jgi:hypothetical protein
LLQQQHISAAAGSSNDELLRDLLGVLMTQQHLQQ